MRAYEAGLECVQVIDAPTSDDLLVGWDGPGWYFEDETGNLHGPFATRSEVDTTLAAYAVLVAPSETY